MKSVRTDPRNHAAEGDERHAPCYPATLVDCLLSELRDMFFYPGATRRIPPVLLLPRFEERVRQFKDEIAAERNQSAPTHGDKP